MKDEEDKDETNVETKLGLISSRGARTSKGVDGKALRNGWIRRVSP